MCNKHLNKKVNLGFNDTPLSPGNHICLIYSDEASRKRLTHQFLEQAFKDKEGLFFAANDKSVDEVFEYLEHAGIDVKAAIDSGQLALDDSKQFYYPEGVFSAEAMWERLRHGYDASLKKGYKGWRGGAKMSWALDDKVPGKEELIKYERGVNQEILTRPFTAICQYDANLFNAEQLMEVLRVHPYMIASGKVVENPHFVPEKDDKKV